MQTNAYLVLLFVSSGFFALGKLFLFRSSRSGEKDLKLFGSDNAFEMPFPELVLPQHFLKSFANA